MKSLIEPTQSKLQMLSKQLYLKTNLLRFKFHKLVLILSD